VPSLGHIAGSLATALVVTLVFLLWIAWPGFLAVGIGAVFGVAFLIVATSLGVDPRAADQAWRQHAADLLRGEAGGDPGSASPPGRAGPSGDGHDGTPAP
jgi:hypothetical protein